VASRRFVLHAARLSRRVAVACRGAWSRGGCCGQAGQRYEAKHSRGRNRGVAAPTRLLLGAVSCSNRQPGVEEAAAVTALATWRGREVLMQRERQWPDRR
jgi:hypothetical protein